MLPLTLSVNVEGPVPAVALPGDKELIAGDGSVPEGPEIVKETAFELTA